MLSIAPWATLHLSTELHQIPFITFWDILHAHTDHYKDITSSAEVMKATAVQCWQLCCHWLSGEESRTVALVRLKHIHVNYTSQPAAILSAAGNSVVPSWEVIA